MQIYRERMRVQNEKKKIQIKTECVFKSMNNFVLHFIDTFFLPCRDGESIKLWNM